MKDKEKGKLFCCYSVPLKDFIYQHGIMYDLCALNPNSKNMFWAYLRTEKLNEVLDEWATYKR